MLRSERMTYLIRKTLFWGTVALMSSAIAFALLVASSLLLKHCVR